MKRIILTLLATSLLPLFLSACSASTNTPTDAPSKTPSKYVVDYKHIYFNDYEAYCDYVDANRNRFPENYVHIENLACLGTFNYMVVNDPVTTALFTYFCYTLDTPWGELFMYVRHNGTPTNMDSFPAIDMESATAEASSLRNITTGGTKVSINRDGIIFRYHASGELRDIIWFVDSVMYHIYFNDAPLDAFAEHHPLLSKLLSLSDDDFQAAKAQLMSIGADSAEVPATAPTDDSD